MKLKNYTSEIPANRIIGMIEDLLVEAGAYGITKAYEEKQPVSISFLMMVQGETMAFKVSAKVANVEKILRGEVKKSNAGTDERIKKQAIRTAWKNIFDLIDAQVAMIMTEEVEILEAFLPWHYLPESADQRTLWEKLQEGGHQKLLRGKVIL